MAKNEFLLPDDLGWACNDEVHKVIADWLQKVSKYWNKQGAPVGNELQMFMTVAIAELSDDVYSVIKKYTKSRRNSKMKLVVFNGADGWYYHLKGTNGQTMLTSERYYTKWNAKRAADKLSKANNIPLEVKYV
jgi:uncharacterized protein YegP (UPF0339 family)